MRHLLPLLLVLPLAAHADAETRVTAERVEGTPEETSAFFHENGVEQFAFRTTVPVTVTVRRIDRTDWTEEDIADAARQVATCPFEGPFGVARQIDGPVLVLTFNCSQLF